MFGLSTRKQIDALRTDILRRENEIHGLHRELAAEKRRATDADRRADIAQNNFEWARVSLNRVEQERSLLLSNLLKFPVPAVAIERQTPFEIERALTSMDDSIFEDIGDEEAKRKGLIHDVDGSVVDRQDG
jgi:hypothetical protein